MRDPLAIHEAEQLAPWLRDMAHCLGAYYRGLKEQGVWGEDEIRLMVRRMEWELFGYPGDPANDGATWEIEED